MSNKIVWVAIVVLILVGLYYWLQPAVEVELASPVEEIEVPIQ